MASRTSTRLHPEPRAGSRICPGFGTCNTHCAERTAAAEIMWAARSFGTLPRGFRGGLSYHPWTAGLMKKRAAEVGRDDPVAESRPAGAVRLLTSRPPRKIIEAPSEVVIVSERDVTYRQISTDGRPLPKDASPSPNGYSTGRWQGDRLVVETNGLRDGTWLDRRGNPLTDAARLTVRFRCVSYGLLEIELMIDDSKAYTRPFTSKATNFSRATPNCSTITVRTTKKTPFTPSAVTKLRAAGLEQLTRIAGTRQDAV